MDSEYSSAKIAHKPVWTSSEKQTTCAKSLLLEYIYTVPKGYGYGGSNVPAMMAGEPGQFANDRVQ